ncbi:MAG TPA: DNA-binding response regulator [Gammaproteobacteria bacterium]|nr:DNA-binding response regulator [Gammaproteobacteria bacterium]
MTITVLLADDHVLFRQGLALLVREHGDWQVVGEAGHGEEAVALAQAHQPQIAVLDVEMPGINGIEAARHIRQVSPGTRIVALSMYGDIHYQERMFEAGASAYVLKNEAIDDLVKAIEAALRGERFISPAVTQYGSMAAQRSVHLDKHALSEREVEVLRRLAEGQRIKEIADGLSISAKTVETYRSRMMLKLGIDNLPGLVKFAIRAGIASPQI